MELKNYSSCTIAKKNESNSQRELLFDDFAFCDARVFGSGSRTLVRPCYRIAISLGNAEVPTVQNLCFKANIPTRTRRAAL